MPLYELLCITAHYPEWQHLRGLVRQTAMHILNNHGVVRQLHSMGTQTLPQRMHRHQQYFTYGDIWQIRFDASPRTMRTLASMMRRDPRVIRWTTLKLGERVQDVVRAPEKTIDHYESRT